MPPPRLPAGPGWITLLVMAFGVAGACGDDGATAQPDATFSRPTGWTAQTHGKSATPDYETVLPADRVQRIDLVIAAADWQAMQDDLTGILGAPGTGQHTGPGPVPPGDGGRPPPPGAEDGGLPPPPGAEDGGIPAPPGPSDGGEPLPPEAADGGVPGPGDTQGGVPEDRVSEQPIYVPCTVTFNGLSWQYVGVRFKGNSTLAGPWSIGVGKLPLRLDFDHFDDEHPEVDGQRFYGFEALAFGNNANDQSLLRDRVAADLFREAGLPTARSAFFRVYVDHGQGPTYFGLYTGVEVPDKPMLDAQFGDSSGNLYKPEGEGARWLAFDEASFEKKSNESENDWSDVRAAIAALTAERRTGDAAAWRAGLEATFDADGFLRWLAVNTLIGNWDTYGQMTHNYYLYGDPADGGRLHWIPWDHNEALASGERTLSLGLAEVDPSWPLIRFLMDDPVYRARYLVLLRETADGVFSFEQATARMQTGHELIAPFVVGEEGEQPGYTFLKDERSFEAALQELIAHVGARLTEVEAFLGAQ